MMSTNVTAILVVKYSPSSKAMSIGAQVGALSPPADGAASEEDCADDAAGSAASRSGGSAAALDASAGQDGPDRKKVLYLLMTG